MPTAAFPYTSGFVLLSRSRRTGAGAFTLIELLTVLAIVCVLAAIITVAVRRAMISGKIAVSQSNLRQIGVTLDLYAADNKGAYPLIYDSAASKSWIATVWPYNYGTVRFPGTTPDALAGSIFYTPFVEDGTVARTFGINEPLQLQYPSRLYKKVVSSPARTGLVGDVKTSGSFRVDQVNYRNEGRAHVLYLDGHVGAVTSAEVPVSTVSDFWTGSQ